MDQSKCCLKPNELTSEQLTLLEDKQLKPGNFCSCGFMSVNDKLLEIYQTDFDTMQNKNISIQQIVDILMRYVGKYKRKAELTRPNNVGSEYSPEIKKLHDEELLKLDRDIFSLNCNTGYDKNGKVEFSNPIIIDNKYIITRRSYWGFQPCPFVCFSDRVFRSTEGGGDDYWIYDIKTKKSIQFNDLLIHLIRDHHFFEGNVYHRLAPNDIIDFFNLQPGVDYSNEFIEVDRWIRISEGGDNSPCHIYGDGNKVNITRKDENTVIIECTQRDISQKFIGCITLKQREEVKTNPNPLLERLAQVRHEYVYYETLVDDLPIRHKLDLKKISTYTKEKVSYLPIDEEKTFIRKYNNGVFTTIKKDSYTEIIIIDGLIKHKDVFTNIFGEDNISIS